MQVAGIICLSAADLLDVSGLNGNNHEFWKDLGES